MEKEQQNHRRKKKATKKQRQKRKVILAVVAVVLVLILGVLAFAANKLGKMNSIKLKNIKVNDLAKETREGMKGYTTLALFGLDNRSNGNFERGNSDTMIVASINEDTGEIKMASVYRDSYLDIGDGTFNKANAAYANGGPQQAVDMLNTNLDLNVTDYVAVDFNALVDAIDSLGGIELEINNVEATNMSGFIDEINGLTGRDSSHVGAGTQVCDGVQATAYARIRQTTGWDFKRTERQRTVITKMFEKAKQTDILTLNSMLDKILPKVSTSLSTAELLSLAGGAAKYNMGENTGFPFETKSGDIGKLRYLEIPVNLEADVVQLHQFLYKNESYAPSQKVKDISAAIKANAGY